MPEGRLARTRPARFRRWLRWHYARLRENQTRLQKFDGRVFAVQRRGRDLVVTPWDSFQSAIIVEISECQKEG